MKKLLLLLTFTGLAVSCSDDEDKAVVVPPPVVTSETYLLTGFNTATPTDLNGDGTASPNQMSETACYNATTITVKSDNTFTAQQNGVYIDTDVSPSTIECYEDPQISGTWAIADSVITFSYVIDGEASEQEYDINATSLSTTYSDDFIVTRDITGAPVYITTDLTIIYTKQ